MRFLLETRTRRMLECAGQRGIVVWQRDRIQANLLQLLVRMTKPALCGHFFCPSLADGLMLALLQPARNPTKPSEQVDSVRFGALSTETDL
ncbi:hypothetical protein BURKHO8Y_240220 [Burkholderia sp. 8Y]|nr:hypothetical protein BURKHO8Y_240220 [Burkholderia sp. 8Y]